MHVIPRYRDKTKDELVLPWRPDVPGDRDALAAVAARLAGALD
ncbi:histidine triad (HIT) family protein [Gordonia hydrophobica]|nr:histidine triad (HIT) family protein [Gordonia hydrophobica]